MSYRCKIIKRQVNMIEGKLLTAQQVAEKLGISKQTLFRYEKKGVFPKARRNLINRWRQYTEDDLKKLREIIRGSLG
jgi:DNA-binding transcriptional MerR regulator